MKNIDELTKEEVDNLIRDYQRPASEITVAQIIEKYDLNIKSNKIAGSLPEQITEEICPYCNEKMYAKIRNRSEMGVPGCKKCGHVLYKESRRSWIKEKCDCENCQKVKEEEQKVKREILKSIYGRECESFGLEELTLKEKVKLIELVKRCPKDGQGLVIGNYFDAEVRELYKKNILRISPLSPIDAFSDEDFPFRIYLTKVIFDINVDQLNTNNVDTLLETEYEKATAREKYELFLDVMHKDVLERFALMMHERGLDFEVLTNAEDSLKMLYSEISYAQIMTLCFNVARYYLDQTKTGKIYKKAAAKGAVKSVVTFYHNRIDKGWQINNSEVKYAGRELKYFVTEIMKQDLRILRNVVTVKDFE